MPKRLASWVLFRRHFGRNALSLRDDDEAIVLFNHGLDVADHVLTQHGEVDGIASHPLVFEERDLDRQGARSGAALADHPQEPTGG